MDKKRNVLFVAICLLPTIALFGTFSVYPFAQALLMAFYDWSGVTDNRVFVGFEHFKVMWNDRIVWIALKNNLFLLLIVPLLTMSLSLLFAVVLTRKQLKEKMFYRTVFFFPNVLALVVISILWSFIYHPTFGILNSILEALGLEQWVQAWLGQSDTVLWAIAMPMVWQAVGYYMIIYIAAIEGVPTHLYESALLEGATEVQRFFFITLPLIWDIIRITIVFFLSGVFTGVFVYINIMTAGGPNNASEVLMTYMYKQAFSNGNYGYGMAVGILMLLVTITLTLLADRLTKRESIQY
ncbi:carbohydrate ABC transporter permease [Paenibacillus sp. PAMC21692]|uniref:carbohydrate ABC transporter permease n=1 Tax=Paenibacillus sp. PAMC21692 TaxID=2762320 RepID=UPI00164DCBE7|nr:sugar ABC transporter permease [Paenibacillus sp. PAMC21692]QNK57956.1 sugar ABC transporter permease [Paenibacillus sp. PAMC21692]